MKDTLHDRAKQEYIMAGGLESEWPFIDQITRNEYMKLAQEQREWERRVSTAVRSSDT